MSVLLYKTPQAWVETVLSDFDRFLQDHAAAEKKASGMALSMVSHYPDRFLLVDKLSKLAVEELDHFREVVKILLKRGVPLGRDGKDEYVNQFRKAMRQGSDVYLLDRLLTAGIIEARGAERFGMVAKALEEGELKVFYQAITDSESRHLTLFSDLAKHYFDDNVVDIRAAELSQIEAEIVAGLPLKPTLH